MLPEIFIDTSKVDEIVTWSKKLPISGVTTNQAIMTKEGVPPSEVEQVIKQICCVLPHKPISVELLDSERLTEELIEEAKYFASFSSDIVVKVPTIGDGQHLEIIRKLREENIKVNSTLNVTAEQLMVAAFAGANYVSLFFNRAKDAGEDPVDHIERMANLIAKRNFDTRIIVGSIRGPVDVTEAIAAGSDIVTIPPKILKALVFHPKSEEIRREFDEQGRKFLEIVRRIEENEP